MRVAYADPPYIGQAKRHYSHDPRCAEVDHADLVEKLEVLVGNPSLRNALGVAGRRRAQAAFSADLVTTEMANFLQRMFDERQQMTRDEP